MGNAQEFYPDCPEAYVVGLARSGDALAFADLVRRRQSWIRNLMRRNCKDEALADDLAQQVFLKAWTNIHALKQAGAFPGWLKKLAISVWLLHLRKNDALRNSDELMDEDIQQQESPGIKMDLDHALEMLSPIVRSCIVLSYHEGMTHQEISDAIDLPLGTVKSHINRGTKKLKDILTAYEQEPIEVKS